MAAELERWGGLGALYGTSASVIWVWQRDYQTDSILNRPDAIAQVGQTSKRGGRVVTIGDTSTLLARDEHNLPLPERDRQAVLQSPAS